MPCIAGLACALALVTHASAAGGLTVSAAISLTEVLEAIGRAYERAGGERVDFNFGASNVLARQIVNGAPVDVFISADAAQMQVVERAGVVARDTLVPLVGNALAIVVRKDHAIAGDPAAALRNPSLRRIAIGNPEAVPAGVYARHYLERIGLWPALQPRLVLSSSGRAALRAVETGAADAGIVYVTDARSGGVRIAAVIRGPDAPEIVYPAAVIESSRRRPAALAFLEFLQTAPARELFAAHGFGAPPGR